MKICDKYGELADKISNHAVISGRRPWQQSAMKNVVPDIVKKLQIKESDTVLDIGCNIGEVTIPISFLCKEIMGVDAEGCIEQLRLRTQGTDNIRGIAGDFLKTDIKELFDCIIMYSVLPHMQSYEEALEMVKKAASLLKSGGRLLVGDVTNADKSKRMHDSAVGAEINREYQEQAKKASNEEDVKLLSAMGEIGGTFHIDDEIMMKLLLELRKEGYEAYLLPQNHKLPWGYSREDILINKW